MTLDSDGSLVGYFILPRSYQLGVLNKLEVPAFLEMLLPTSLHDAHLAPWIHEGHSGFAIQFR